MIRLHVVVEGQTEETFVREIVAPDLIAQEVFATPRKVRTSKAGSHPHKGGGNRYKHWRREIQQTLKSERGNDVFLTTMVDLYRLPTDFPGSTDCSAIADPSEKVKCLEQKLMSEISDPRFIPYIQLHEFEALLLSTPECFRIALRNDDERIRRLQEVCTGFQTVDEIDEGPTSAPSQRILTSFPEYGDDKPNIGVIIALEIGLGRMLDASPHFRQWIETLRNLRPLGDTASNATS